MPYINQADRDAVYPSSLRLAITPGELNFQITVLIDSYLRSHANSYETRNAILGVLEAAKHEFYVRRVTPYEMCKLAENGDVYL